MIRARRLPPLLPLALAVLSLSCASSEQLTRRSERLLVQGDARKAYDTALGALEKDPRNEAARGALGAAGQALIADARTRFYNLIPDDTLGGARVALDVEDLRATLLRCRADGPIDTAFAGDMRRARDASADDLMRVARDSLSAGRARPAYRLLEEAARFSPHRRDLDARLRRTFELAVDRVAVLPLDDQAGQPALPRLLSDRLAAALRKRVADQKLTFTRLVDPAKVYGRMSVAQLGDLSRAEALALGRDVGATVVLWGRLHDAGSDSYTTHYREPLWHKVVDHDRDGNARDRWVEVPFESIVRERVYHLRWDLRLLSVDDETTLAERSEPREVRARAVWTSFRPDDDPANYALVPPDVRHDDPDRAGRIDKEWSDATGRWTLQKLLGRARASDAGSRAAYRHEYRGEFEHMDRAMPVFLGDVPGNDDLALIAVRDLDDAFLAMIGDLDRR